MRYKLAHRLAPPASALALLAALLPGGCAKPPAAVAEAPPPLPPHLGPPPAAICTLTPFHVTDGGIASVAMTISNDGGYCAVTLTSGSGQAFDAGLVPIRPQHGGDNGGLSVVHYNQKTNIEYWSAAKYVGQDRFTVHLIKKDQPGSTTVNVAVTVVPPGTAAKTS